jgi:choline dehydrogenase-like flavoprotein
MKTNVCIIGSGVGGSVTAERMMERGVTGITMVECGERVLMRDYRTWLDLVTRTPSPETIKSPDGAFIIDNTMLVPAYGRRRFTDEEVENVGPIKFDVGGYALRIRGGTTVHFEGWCYRLKPEDFELRTRTGQGADWPIGYRDLEPYYAIAERTMQVSGDASDTDHPPRSGPFPLPPMPFQRADTLFLKGMKANGWDVSHVALARNTESINGQVQCQTTGTCHYCPIGGRFSGDQVLDRLEAKPGFQLLTDTTALRFISNGAGSVRALEVLDQKTGKTYEIEADRFILAAGAIGTPTLLLASAGGAWPAGPGNHSDMVGRNLMNHPLILARSPGPVPGQVPSETDFPTAFSRHFDTPQEQKTGKFVISNQGLSPDLRWQMFNGRDSERFKQELAQGWPIGLVVTMGEQVADPANRVTLRPGTSSVGTPRMRVAYGFSDQVRAMDARQRQVQRALFAAMGVDDPVLPPMGIAAHPMGTCKMAVRPEDGVVDAYLKVHGIDNLYVCSSAVFPSGGAGNPTLTIVALAHRLGDHLTSGA